MCDLKISVERQEELKKLWDDYKKERENEVKELEDKANGLLEDWKEYRVKIENGTLSLDDYTNRVNSENAAMPGGYLCNFLERTTTEIFGYSRAGNANYFEVKLNNDNTTYYIRSEKKENASRLDAEKYFNENIQKLLKSIVSENDPLKKADLIDKANYSAKQILMKIAVLENIESFLQIYANWAINILYKEFVGDDNGKGTLEKNHEVCKQAKKQFGVEENNNQFVLLSWFLWEYANTKAIADENNPNVILYGPPGTGKTYSVFKNLSCVCQGDSSRYEILQFHPSFTYEDFIEGIKPKGVSNDGNIRFELVNGVFKNFCIKAKNNPEKEYYFVVDEINRANLSAVLGETLSLLEKDYRHDTENESKENLISTQYSSLIKNLIEEEENKKNYEHLAYYYDKKEGVKFGIPKNIFFIGTMNDVDKSIDTFDLALRRRFKWIRKDCDYIVIKKETRYKGKNEFSNIQDYVESCKKLNEYISQTLGLGKSYELGHSFFMKMSDIAKSKTITQKNAEDLFELYLRPTLKEYIRAIFSENELDDKLKEALKEFKEKLKKDEKQNDL